MLKKKKKKKKLVVYREVDAKYGPRETSHSLDEINILNYLPWHSLSLLEHKL